MMTNTNMALSIRLAKQVRARNKQCFVNAFSGAGALNGLYVEGYAIGTRLPIVIAHGWVEVHGEIVDPTPAWHEPGCRYFPAARYTVAEAMAAATKTKRYLPLNPVRIDCIPKEYWSVFEEATLAAMGEVQGRWVLDAMQRNCKTGT